MITRRAMRWADDRLGGAHATRSALDKAFPDHASFMLGEIAAYAFMVLVVSGTFLTLFFHPSDRPVVYEGSYAPLHGQQLSAAYESAVRLSFDVRLGLFARQVHHWAALVFLAAIVAHLGRIFFTGAFRRPRELNWIVGLTMFLLALANGFAGYSLLDDLLSGTGLRIAHALLLGTPVIGTWAASLAFGGDFPGDVLGRLFILHVLIIPGAIVGLLSAHLAMVWHQKHTQFPGPGRTEGNVVGSRLWPTYATRSISLGLAVASVLVLLGGLVQINPVWLYGPYDPTTATTASQPDWYVGWMEGGLRLMPGWEPRAFGLQLPNPWIPGVLLPGVTFLVLYLWPFLEARVTGDHDEHHLLDQPRSRPVRTALGAGALSFYGVLFAAGSSDVLARTLHVPIGGLVDTLRVALLVAPVVVGLLTWATCRRLPRLPTGPEPP